MTRSGSILTVAALLLLPACTRSNSSGEAKRPPQNETVRPTAFGAKQSDAPETSDDPQPEEKSEKRGVLARVFSSGSTTPGYGWDGQQSSTTMKLPLSTTQGRAIDTLRALGFVINTDQTKRQERVATVSAGKADRTTVLINLEEKVAGSTDVKVRVGQTGDRGSSERVLDEMQKTPAPRGAARRAAPPAPRGDTAKTDGQKSDATK